MGPSAHQPSLGLECCRLRRRGAPVPGGGARSLAAAAPDAAPPGSAGAPAPALARSRWMIWAKKGLKKKKKVVIDTDAQQHFRARWNNRSLEGLSLDGHCDVQNLVSGDEPGHVMPHCGEGQDTGSWAVRRQATVLMNCFFQGINGHVVRLLTYRRCRSPVQTDGRSEGWLCKHLDKPFWVD